MPTNSAPHLVFYDGACAFCRKSIAILQALDWLGKLGYVNVRQEGQPAMEHPLVRGAPVLEQMHVLPAHQQKLYGGYAAMRWLAWRLPLLWTLAPLLYLPGVTQLGDRLYRWVARNRFKIIPCHDGVCTLHQKR